MISKILIWVGTDGLLHILMSIVIMLLVRIIAPWWLAIIVTVLTGIIKELVYDMAMRKGTPQWKDILCDIVGILIGCLTFI